MKNRKMKNEFLNIRLLCSKCPMHPVSWWFNNVWKDGEDHSGDTSVDCRIQLNRFDIVQKKPV